MAISIQLVRSQKVRTSTIADGVGENRDSHGIYINKWPFNKKPMQLMEIQYPYTVPLCFNIDPTPGLAITAHLYINEIAYPEAHRICTDGSAVQSQIGCLRVPASGVFGNRK
jgi:hypothetical protein